MLFQKLLKNSINNNDYFRIKKSKANANNKNRYIFNNSYMFRNYNHSLNDENDNNSNDLILSNNISAQNYLAKYKQNIIKRENIIEQNYKNYNKYKNIFYNKINFDKNIKRNPLRNDSKITFKREGNRLYKSDSFGNVFKNSFYLSEQLDTNTNNKISPFKCNINNSNRFFDKRRTDITDNSIIEIKNNKQGFVDYYNKVVEVSNENIKMSEEKKNIKEQNLFKSRLKERNNMNLENTFFKNMSNQDLFEIKQCKLRYKSLLDEQVKNNLTDKLMKENLTYRDLVDYKRNIPLNKILNDRDFLNVNNFVEVNPYKQRNYHLGNSFLKKDLINKPQSLFKTNKYFFPKNDIGEVNY